MIGYAIALLPLYFFVYLPLSNLLAGSLQLNHEIIFNASFVAPDEPITCPSHDFNVHVVSREPLVMYLPNFISPAEAAHIIVQSEPNFQISSVSTGPDTKVDPSVRLSEVATLERDDIVRCIESRARSLQGWRANLFIEKIKAQRYGVSGHYVHHYDWSGGGNADRVSSFMIYVSANCTGGGTSFPRLPKPTSTRWCDYIECDETGVTFKPIAGNAVFWENLRPDGSGYPETWHAGLPVLSGTKIGLNIWSWQVYRP